MNYYTIDPPKNLAEQVRFFWVLEGKPTALRPFVHRALAEHCAELIFYYKGGFKILSDNYASGETFSSGIYGPTQQFYKFKTEKEFGMLGVYLYPYAIPQLFALPAHELSNGMLDLKTLSGQGGKLLIHEFQRFSGYRPKEFFKQEIAPSTYRAAPDFKRPGIGPEGDPVLSRKTYK